jgi:hypothetical protein
MSVIRMAGGALARTGASTEIRRIGRAALYHVALVGLALFLILVVLPVALSAAAAAGG